MITYPRWLESDPRKAPVLRLIGIGNAGVNIVDRIAMRGSLPLETVALNSDLHSLNGSVAEKKIALGPLTTHGLGAGGDPERGLEAARESLADLREAVDGADVVFLCAGLGGGTGSPTAPVLAEIARRNGSLVVAVVTTPFQFEGRRRSQQAQEALRELESRTDALVHFGNDRMVELSAPRAEASETFAACDDLLFLSIASMTRIISSRGPLPVSIPDLLSTLRGANGPALFGCGESAGANRAHEALEQALRSPLLDRGRLLHEAGKLLVHLSGPPSLAFVEVAAIMQEITKNTASGTLLQTGITIVSDDAAPLTVTLLGQCGVPQKVESRPPAPVAATVPEPPREPVAPTPVPRAVEPLPPKSAAPKITQENLPLEPIARGRFDKIEPTIFEGEDLDIPTFLRMKIKK